MVAPTQGQRNLKNAYRKKGFQTPYSKQGDSVDPSPPPVSSYGTTLTAPTSPHRKGLTSPVQQRPVRSRFGDKSAFRSYNYNITPWHLYPKADSSNVIKRNLYDTNAATAIGSTTVIQEVFMTDSGLRGDFVYQIVIDGQISLQWTNFQLGPTTPSNQMFHFENPLVVKDSFRFQIVNNSSGTYNYGTAGNEVDSQIVGWTEQYAASSETSHEDIEQS
jgi:hypothetical protein